MYFALWSVVSSPFGPDAGPPSSSESYSSPSATLHWESVCPSLFPRIPGHRNGSLQRNITALVGSLFPKSERDAAYSRFYWAVNLGSLPSGLVGAWLSSRYTFRSAFLLCFAVMALLIPFGILFATSFVTLQSSPNLRNTTPRIMNALSPFILLPVAMLFFVRSTRPAHR